MITLKVLKPTGVHYLIGLEPSDLDDLSKEDAVMTFNAADCKISLMKVNGSREEFLEHIKTFSGLNDQTSLITKP